MVINVMPDLSASQANFMHTDFIALKLMSNEVNSGSSMNFENSLAVIGVWELSFLPDFSKWFSW